MLLKLTIYLLHILDQYFTIFPLIWSWKESRSLRKNQFESSRTLGVKTRIIRFFITTYFYILPFAYAPNFYHQSDIRIIHMQASKIIPNPNNQNLARIVDDGPVSKQFSISDLVYQRFGGISQELLDKDITQIAILSKKLEQPLPWYKKIGALILSIKVQHQFLLFEIEEGDLEMTVDFYQENKLLIRIGDEKTVLNETSKRSNAQIVKSGVLQWKLRPKKGHIKVKEVIEYIEKSKMKTYKQTTNSGTQFSRQVFEYFSKKQE